MQMQSVCRLSANEKQSVSMRIFVQVQIQLWDEETASIIWRFLLIPFFLHQSNLCKKPGWIIFRMLPPYRSMKSISQSCSSNSSFSISLMIAWIPVPSTMRFRVPLHTALDVPSNVQQTCLCFAITHISCHGDNASDCCHAKVMLRWNFKFSISFVLPA